MQIKDTLLENLEVALELVITRCHLGVREAHLLSTCRHEEPLHKISLQLPSGRQCRGTRAGRT